MTVKLSQELVSFVRPSEHSTFSPSGTDRWVACPASIQLSEGIPDETSKYAIEGTLAHKVCEDYFYHKYEGKEKTPDLMMAEEEMIDCATIYYDCLMGWLSNADDIGTVLWYGLEKGIPIFPELGCFGTADFLVVGTRGCAIIDYKHGKGRAVGANSSQLRNYLLGFFRYLIDIPEDYKFHAVVVQPRIGAGVPVYHEYTKADLKAFEAEVYSAILKAGQPGLEPVLGSHCFWCKAKRTHDPLKKCPAVKEKQLRTATENFDGFLTDMNIQPGKDKALADKRDKALIKIMSLVPIMQDIAKDAETEFRYRIEQGELIPGVRMAKVPGRNKWRLDDPKEMGVEIQKLYPNITPCEFTQPKLKVKSMSKIKKELKLKELDPTLTIRPIKDEILVEDEKRREVLSSLDNYAKMIGLNDSK